MWISPHFGPGLKFRATQESQSLVVKSVSYQKQHIAMKTKILISIRPLSANQEYFKIQSDRVANPCGKSVCFGKEVGANSIGELAHVIIVILSAHQLLTCSVPPSSALWASFDKLSGDLVSVPLPHMDLPLQLGMTQYYHNLTDWVRRCLLKHSRALHHFRNIVLKRGNEINRNTTKERQGSRESS